MRTLTDQLAQYAAYHRDKRNIATHFVGIPMIALAIAMLLSRPAFEVLGLTLTPAVLVVVPFVVYYFVLDRGYGVAMLALNAAFVWVGYAVAQQATGVWLTTGIGLFVVGWVLQFIGHYWEGRKPAFVDDIIGLVIGPLFVVAEASFAFGLRPELNREIERRVGPTLIRQKTAAAG